MHCQMRILCQAYLQIIKCTSVKLQDRIPAIPVQHSQWQLGHWGHANLPLSHLDSLLVLRFQHNVLVLLLHSRLTPLRFSSARSPRPAAGLFAAFARSPLALGRAGCLSGGKLSFCGVQSESALPSGPSRRAEPRGANRKNRFTFPRIRPKIVELGIERRTLPDW